MTFPCSLTFDYFACWLGCDRDWHTVEKPSLHPGARSQQLQSLLSAFDSLRPINSASHFIRDAFHMLSHPFLELSSLCLAEDDQLRWYLEPSILSRSRLRPRIIMSSTPTPTQTGSSAVRAVSIPHKTPSMYVCYSLVVRRVHLPR